MKPTLDRIEQLYEKHDDLCDHPIRKGDRALADQDTFRRLFAWQFCEYQNLLLQCMKAGGANCKEFQMARKMLRNAEQVAKGRDGDPRLATARAEFALQWIHKWLERARREAKQ